MGEYEVTNNGQVLEKLVQSNILQNILNIEELFVCIYDRILFNLQCTALYFEITKR